MTLNDTITAPPSDDFQVPRSRKQPSAKKGTTRVYIGNLPAGNVTESIPPLSQILKEKTSHDFSVRDFVGGRSHVFLSCPSNHVVEQVIASMDQQEFLNSKLVVQRERKPKRDSENSKNKNLKQLSPFGRSSWSKPADCITLDPPTRESKEMHHTQKADILAENANQQFCPTSGVPLTNEGLVDPAIGEISDAIMDEMQSAVSTGSTDAVLNTTLATLAAVSFLAPAIEEEDSTERSNGQHVTAFSGISIEGENNVNGGDEVSLDDFRTRLQKPLSELLNDYGEKDQNLQPTLPKGDGRETLPAMQDPQEQEITFEKQVGSMSRLGQHGKAPIHVEFVSYGYVHGAPAAIRNGWSHAQPLPAFECRDLPVVPGHLAWRDGVSGYVQRILLAEPEVKSLSTSLANQTFIAVQEAISGGGHGYASPLQMKIYAGSENGKHRSVVICEQSAKSLRNLLRRNENNLVSVPVSVGTFHRDLERAKKAGAHEKSSRKKEDLSNGW